MAIHLYRTWSRLFLVIFITSLSLTSCDGASDSQNVEVTGKSIYQNYCSACHGKDGMLKSGNAADLSMSTINDDSIRQVILYGNNKGMGPYKSIIKSDEEIKLLVEHVKTLRKN